MLQGFSEVALRPFPGFDLPEIDCLELERQGLDAATVDACRDAVFDTLSYPSHKMGGWARPIQNAM